MSSKQERLEQLQQHIENNLACPLKEAATQMVFGKGNPDASIVCIGEAPGAKEDELGIPFVGRAGKELDKLLRTISLSLEDVYIANILKYRPPKNRDPLPHEISQHTPYLIKQLEIIKPRIVLTLGNYATKFVLAGFQVQSMKKIPGVGKLHGNLKRVKYNELVMDVMPMFHPAAMMYNPKLRPLVEKDFLVLAKRLNLPVQKNALEQQTLTKF